HDLAQRCQLGLRAGHVVAACRADADHRDPLPRGGDRLAQQLGDLALRVRRLGRPELSGAERETRAHAEPYLQSLSPGEKAAPVRHLEPLLVTVEPRWRPPRAGAPPLPGAGDTFLPRGGVKKPVPRRDPDRFLTEGRCQPALARLLQDNAFSAAGNSGGALPGWRE